MEGIEPKQQLLEMRKKYGGFAFDTPDKSLYKNACTELQVSAEEVNGSLELEEIIDDEILRADIIKIIRSSKDEIGIIWILNRDNGKFLMKEALKTEDYIVSTLQKRFEMMYQKALQIV